MSTCPDLTHLSYSASSMLTRRSYSKLLPARLADASSSPFALSHNPTRFRCVFDHVYQRMAVSASLSSVITSGNVIAAAAAAATGAGTAHGAVTSAIAHVAVTAVAIASGACLSTKVDFLWPRVEQQPDSIVLDGVDVTGYTIFNDPKVQKAIAFARKAHHGQFRKTGEPYLTHCIHTGRILAAMVPPSGNRAIDTVVSGILHDVIDDTCQTLRDIQEEFGDDVANLVFGVSRLSYINQLLRRHRRSNMNESNLHPEEASNLRVMLLGMVDDPRVVLIKLADRLHNMRTIYALPSSKAQAVAQETLSVWCSLASRLGVWALKAEMEDLCFAVLQPHIFLQMRSELSSMWNPGNKTRNLRRVSPKACLPVVVHDADCQRYMMTEEDLVPMKDLLQAVIPFDLLLDRRKRAIFLNNVGKCSKLHNPKSIFYGDSRIALASLVACEEALERELYISTSYIPGMEVTLSSRLKSLYSIYCKMKRKEIDIGRVYDARALRVIVGDKNGALHGDAVKCCYSLLDIIHRLWSPIDGEFDDYIVNPKPSGYQSLHTAVQGPDGSPLEVQIRTQQMHAHAEYGLAAHWIYKETENKVVYMSNAMHSKGMEEENSFQSDAFRKYNSLKVGHPVLRVDGSHLLAAVIVRVDKGGSELLVAVSFGLGASEAVADRRSSSQIKRWEAYARLYKKVSDQWWFEPGHGDWCTYLEKYKLCRDGMYHKEDQFERLLPTFIQIINLTEQEEVQYWKVVSAVFEGEEVTPISSDFDPIPPRTASCEGDINNKVNLLRTMLQWEEQVHQEAFSGKAILGRSSYYGAKPVVLGEVVIIRWPDGNIMRMRSGSTAADAARRIGLEGKLVLVNGQLAIPNTVLKDGDIVEVRR